MTFGSYIQYAVWSLTIAFAVSVSAANPPHIESVDSILGGISVLYPVASDHLDPSYAGNARHLDAITAWLNSVMACDTLRPVSLTFSGSASPEGAIGMNRDLALRRAKSLERYIRERVQLPDSIVHFQSKGVDWPMLADFVNDSTFRGSDRVLEIISTCPEATYGPDSLLTDSRRKHLMDLDGGRPWNYMESRWFPYLRNASLMVGVRHEQSPKPRQASTPQLDSLAQSPQPAQSAPAPKPFYMSLQTNMLYDVLLLPNLGAEFYLGKGWSIAASWTYGWWDAPSKHNYWRACGAYLAARKWFGAAARRKPLTGHHAGLNAQVLSYDFEFGGDGQMAGTPGKPIWDSPSYSFALEYGYSLPIGPHLNIDFSLAVGYLGGTYYKYTPIDGHYVWQGTSRRNYFGPTSAQISLVWLIGRGNVNPKKQKGGAK